MTPMVRVALAILSAAAVVATVSAQKSPPITGTTLAALESWVASVNSHVPGQPDAAVKQIAEYSYETRVELNGAMNLFLTALLGQRVDTRGNEAARAIVALGRRSGKDLLKRAAVLHADAAAYSAGLPARPVATADAGKRTAQELRVGGGAATPSTLASNEWVPPLLRQDPLLLHQDGQIVGQTVGAWNWPFGRYLLGVLSLPPGKVPREMQRLPRASDPFVAQWYRATTAYLFASGALGDLTSHVVDAGVTLPDDPGVLFDRGCFAEVLGLPMHQALMPEENLAKQGSAGGNWGGLREWRTPGTDERVRISPPARTNADAERLYRQALAGDPLLTEARVRLARLLYLRTRHDEAATELRSALERTTAAAPVAFYAHLFAGRTAVARQRRSEADDHLAAARRLFPEAQSALLASSYAALLGADVPAMLGPIARLGPASAEFTADPWWQYHLCSGRDAESLLRELWQRVPR